MRAIMAATLFYVLALLCFSPLAGLHFRLQAAKFSSSLSMVLNCGNFKGDVDNYGDLGYFILVIRVLNFRQSRRQNLLSKQIRLQNSPYCCVLKYARAVDQKVWNEAEKRERDWGDTLKRRFFFLFSFSPDGRVRLASFALVRLVRHALPISLLVLRKKLTVLHSKAYSALS